MEQCSSTGDSSWEDHLTVANPSPPSSQCDPNDLSANRGLAIVLLGKTGHGKSATGNTILGEKEFTSRSGKSSITKKCQKSETFLDGRDVLFKMAQCNATGDYSSEEQVSNRGLAIVLLGCSGTGKSATGNTLLGEKVFTSRRAGSSVTKECKASETVINGRRVLVVDTPGITRTNDMNDTTTSQDPAKEILDFLHTNINQDYDVCFLFVLSLAGRFTEDTSAYKRLKTYLGEGFPRHTIILYTHKDLNEADDGDEQVVKKNPRSFDEMMEECGMRFLEVTNNKPENKDLFIAEFMEMIENKIPREAFHFEVEDIIRKVEEADKNEVKSKPFVQKLELEKACAEQSRERAEKDKKEEEKKRLEEEQKRKEEENKREQAEKEKKKEEKKRLVEELKRKREEKKREQAEKDKKKEEKKRLEAEERMKEANEKLKKEEELKHKEQLIFQKFEKEKQKCTEACDNVAKAAFKIGSGGSAAGTVTYFCTGTVVPVVCALGFGLTGAVVAKGYDFYNRDEINVRMQKEIQDLRKT